MYFMGNSVSDSVNIMAWLQALLLLSGDIETNPGPPKNRGPPGGVLVWAHEDCVGIIFFRETKRTHKGRDHG